MSIHQKSGYRSNRLLALTLLAGVAGIVFVLTFNDFKKKPTSIPAKTNSHRPDSGENVSVLEVIIPEKPEVLPEVHPVSNPPKNKSGNPTVTFQPLPPIVGITPHTYVEDMDPLEGGNIECATGSVVVFPPGSIVDRSGAPVKEKVKVSFTEYRDYKDIFLSGIPMVFGTRESKQQMESAGMMQLEASAGGNPVYVNPNKSVRVMLASANRSSDYNLYYFNRAKGEWVEKGKDQVSYKKKKQERSVTERKYGSYKPVKRFITLFSFEGIPQDKVFLWWKSPVKKFHFSFTRISKTYPEIKALSTTRWEYTGEDAREVYAQLFDIPASDTRPQSRQSVWDTYEVQADTEKIALTFTFISEDRSLSLTVRPMGKDEQNLMKVKKRIQNFVASRSKRIENDEATYRQYKRDSLAYMNTEFPLVSAGFDVVRTFQVDNFGIWNVDKIVNDKKFVAYQLRFFDENNSEINPKLVYLVDKEYNSVFTYSHRDGEAVRINPFSNNLLWAVLPGNRLAIVKPVELRNLAGRKGNQKVKMDIYDDAVSSIEDVREQLNF